MDIDTLRDILKWFVETAQGKIYSRSQLRDKYSYPQVNTQANSIGKQKSQWADNSRAYPEFNSNWFDKGLRCVHFANGNTQNRNYAYRRATIHFSDAYEPEKYGLSLEFNLRFNNNEDNGADHNKDTVTGLSTVLYNTLGKNGRHSADNENYDDSLEDSFKTRFPYSGHEYPIGLLETNDFQSLYDDFMAVMRELNEFKYEPAESTAWIFQANPKYYDIARAVEELNSMPFQVNQSFNKIKAGDKVFLWMSGSGGGIIGTGQILNNPSMHEPQRDDPYKRDSAFNTQPYRAVDIKIKQRLTSKIVLRTTLLADERTKKLEVLTFPGATNYAVTKEQQEVIENIINGTYKQVPVVDETLYDQTNKRRYWLYAPGEQASRWKEFHDDGIMAVGLGDIGNLTQYQDKAEIKNALKQRYDPTKSYMNDGLALWQFSHEISVGDVVFAKQGQHYLIGKGIVRSDYQFDEARDDYKQIRKVEWTHEGKWEFPKELLNIKQFTLKTLTDITQYTDYVDALETLVSGGEGFGEDEDVEIEYASYSAEDFLNDVFMSESQYETLKNLLLRKKNLILQGAPGVGKTYIAKRLAYSLMGCRDTARVQMIQFHQSYSYEDFVMGFQPNRSGGFDLAEGPFYKFCKMAEDDDERPYFFIIDEINRGNLSKIFGELLMLIEGDKRGQRYSLRLMYKDEQFSVPANVYLIGMMNTADRSLAMIDYALRRRFAFFNIAPAFDSDGFRERERLIANQKYDLLVQKTKQLNEEIASDPSLGEGFLVGHSYFCTTENVTDVWLSSIIEYELLPLLKEYWFDEQSKVDKWSTLLRSTLSD